MSRWLITGGAGFIGANFIRLVLAEWRGVHMLNFAIATAFSARGGAESG